MLIAGRVITGCGSAGITICTYVIISHLFSTSKAPAFIGDIGAAFSIANVAGPLAGEALTGEVCGGGGRSPSLSLAHDRHLAMVVRSFTVSGSSAYFCSH